MESTKMLLSNERLLLPIPMWRGLSSLWMFSSYWWQLLNTMPGGPSCLSSEQCWLHMVQSAIWRETLCSPLSDNEWSFLGPHSDWVLSRRLKRQFRDRWRGNWGTSWKSTAGITTSSGLSYVTVAGLEAWGQIAWEEVSAVPRNWIVKKHAYSPRCRHLESVIVICDFWGGPFD